MSNDLPMPPNLARRFAAFEAERRDQSDHVAKTITIDEFRVLLDHALTEQRKSYERILETRVAELTTDLFRRIAKLELQLGAATTAREDEPPDFSKPITRIKIQLFHNQKRQGKAEYRLKIEVWRSPRGKPTARNAAISYLNLIKPGAGLRKSHGTRLDHLIDDDTRLVGRKAPFDAAVTKDNAITLFFKDQQFIATNPVPPPQNSEQGAYQLLWYWNDNATIGR